MNIFLVILKYWVHNSQVNQHETSHELVVYHTAVTVTIKRFINFYCIKYSIAKLVNWF